MARIRTIKPEFYTDEDLAERSIWARFIFPALWQHCDCEGRMEDRPKYLKTQLLPYDDQDLNTLLDELAEHGFIVRYQVEGKRYIFVPNFKEHQRLSGKEASGTSEFPPCPNASQNKPEPTGEALVKHLGSTGERQESQEGKGKESKGRDNPLPPEGDVWVSEVVDYLNQTAGKSFTTAKGTVKALNARLSETSKAQKPEFVVRAKLVIDHKVSQWANTDRAEYIRPETLFAASHWESYVQAAEAWNRAGRPPRNAIVPAALNGRSGRSHEEIIREELTRLAS